MEKSNEIPQIDYDALIAALSKDAEHIKNDPGCMKGIIKKYIVRIDIYKDEIAIYAVEHLVEK